MYKITHINTDFQYKEIPEGIDPNFIRQKTYEEIERLNCQNCTNVYFQESIPSCNSLYWKIIDESVVEMTNEEKLAVDTEISNNLIQTGFKYKKYKVTIASLDKFITTPYEPYIGYCKERSTIETESNTIGEGMNQITESYAWMSYIKGEELEMTDTEFAKSDMAMILFATYPDGSKIFKLETNPLWKQSQA